jgi:hypothetical protein
MRRGLAVTLMVVGKVRLTKGQCWAYPEVDDKPGSTDSAVTTNAPERYVSAPPGCIRQFADSP